MTIRSLPLAALLAAGLLVACSSSDTTGPGSSNNNGGGGAGGGAGNPPPNTVVISNFSFSPAALTVTAGTTVTFQNDDATTHTATADGGTFDTGDLGHGASASHLFDKAGSYSFHCAIHPSMTGVITVQ